MTRIGLLSASAISALAIFSASPAFAQEAPAPASDDQAAQQEIVVTGSIIKGSREDAIAPVVVLSADSLQKLGSPSATELMKFLPSSSGVLGDANQFDSRSQGSEGIANANLRGLGPQRTLVLLNSKRLVTAGNNVPSVDINLIPGAALGSIEVLKDGAAATYGSDAIAGVVNFITRTDQNGFRASAAHRFVQSTNGDNEFSLSYGHVWDNFRVLAAIGYQDRDQLLARDRDFAVQPYANNPQGGWTGGGNPATFLGLGPTGAPTTGLTADSSCVPLGGKLGANGRCYTQYSGFDTLVDKQRLYTAFLDAEANLGENTQFELTALYGRGIVPHYLTSPSYILTQAPSLASMGGTNLTPFVTGFYVPGNNPGFQAYRTANPTAFPNGTTSAVFPLLLFRPFIAGGNPATLGDDDISGAAFGYRKSESARLTAELRGKIAPDINYAISGTYHSYYRYTDGFDSFGDRVQLALRGFGGPNCNIAANTPGQNGCMWLNPFGNAVTNGAINGTTNPQGNSALANSAELANWFFVKSLQETRSELIVVEGSISGATGIHLPGGEVRFGVGAQYRHGTYDTHYGPNNNLAVNPCRDTPITGNQNPAACSPTSGTTPSSPNGALAFGGSQFDNRLTNGIKATFAEVQIPLFPSLDLQASARYEDYGGSVGSTFNPQFRARWQATDWLAFRGGFGTTFRGPNPSDVSSGFITALQLVGAAFKPVDVYGNPSLSPEKSKNYSGGVLLKFGGFNASVDYYRYDLSNVIVADPLVAMLATLFPGGKPNTCAANSALAARFTFANGACTAATTSADVARVRTQLQNNATQSNSGLDFSLNYNAVDIFGPDTRFGAGVDATRALHNRISDIYVGGTRVSAAYDGVGLLNYQSTLYPLPKWKGQAFVDLGVGRFDGRLTVNYVGGLHDQRFDTKSGPFAPDLSISATGANLYQGANIASSTTVDFNLQVQLPWDVTLTGTVFNIFNVDPPFAREDYNYEPFVGNPLGRMFKVGLSAKF